MIEIQIDDKTLEVEQGSMIIEAADNAGIYIPRFCYHKKLSIAANCRMCLVEVEKSPKPLPACATPVTAGMKVFTQSAKAKASQRSVMEFLLINHPLDCPICDQGGECELQDLSLGYGAGISRFNEGKRSVVDENLGSLIETEMTRCIQCTRCVRFGQEIAGIRELGATGRGEHMQISTYVKHSMQSELSGNIIDLCPVGALTSKPFRFKARAWELTQHPSIAPHDCLGSHIYIHSRRQEVMRVVPRENEKINETWLSDRDRFSYTAVNNADRLEMPMIKVKGEWQETDWIKALQVLCSQLKTVTAKHGAEKIAGLISPSATTEEFYLFQKLLRQLGTHKIEHRLHQTDFIDQTDFPLFPGLGIKIAELEEQDQIFLIGSNILREQPLAAHRVRKATLRGAKVMSLNAVDYAFHFDQVERVVCAPNRWVFVLAGVLKLLAENKKQTLSNGMQDFLSHIKPSPAAQALADQLSQAGKKIIMLGALAQNHPEAATLRSLAQYIAHILQIPIGFLTEGANSAGAWVAGAVPHRVAGGESAGCAASTESAVLTEQAPAYFLFNIEPEFDCANPAKIHEQLEKAELVVAFSPFKSESYLKYADVILPIAIFAENEGTFVNAEGVWQSFTGAVPPPGESKLGWKVLRVLANECGLSEFNYETVSEVRLELESLLKTSSPQTFEAENLLFSKPYFNAEKSVTRITEWSIYEIDNVVRRSKPLQDSATNPRAMLALNEKLAKEWKVQEGDTVIVKQTMGKAHLPVKIDNRIADHCVWIPAGYAETTKLGENFGAVEIHVE